MVAYDHCVVREGEGERLCGGVGCGPSVLQAPGASGAVPHSGAWVAHPAGAAKGHRQRVRGQGPVGGRHRGVFWPEDTLNPEAVPRVVQTHTLPGCVYFSFYAIDAQTRRVT